MIKTLAKQIKEFKAASIATPLFMILEVLMEMIIPFLMASIIDKGVNAGDIQHIYKVGGIMVVAAAIGLFAGMMGGRYGAKASAGFARNLREAMFNNIQTFSFANIDKFSTAGLVFTFAIYRIWSDGHGIYDQCKTCMHLSCSGYYSWNIVIPDHEPCDKIFPTGISKVR